MRLREESKQLVSPISFWFAIAAVIVFLGSMGFSFMQTGKVWEIGPRWSVLLLTLAWTVSLLQLWRHGRRAFPLVRLLWLLGFTGLMASPLFPKHTTAAQWSEGLGQLLSVAAALVMIIDFRPHSAGPVTKG